MQAMHIRYASEAVEWYVLPVSMDTTGAVMAKTVVHRI
jgi:hypothetical protein